MTHWESVAMSLQVSTLVSLFYGLFGCSTLLYQICMWQIHTSTVSLSLLLWIHSVAAAAKLYFYNPCDYLFVSAVLRVMWHGLLKKHKKVQTPKLFISWINNIKNSSESNFSKINISTKVSVNHIPYQRLYILNLVIFVPLLINTQILGVLNRFWFKTTELLHNACQHG